MIPGPPWRNKGGAPLLGAAEPGQPSPSPFGTGWAEGAEQSEVEVHGTGPGLEPDLVLKRVKFQD